MSDTKLVDKKSAPRVAVNVRMSEAATALVDAEAQREDRTRSAMLRILVKEALTARMKGRPRG